MEDHFEQVMNRIGCAMDAIPEEPENLEEFCASVETLGKEMIECASQLRMLITMVERVNEVQSKIIPEDKDIKRDGSKERIKSEQGGSTTSWDQIEQFEQSHKTEKGEEEGTGEERQQ